MPPSPAPLRLPPRFAGNQLLPVRAALSGELGAIISSFRPPIRYAFAYGSAVFPQKSYPQRNSHAMLDFIFAVSHPSHWHSINLRHNPSHYSLPARILGSPGVTWLQEHGPGAGLWFNVQAKINDRVIKYGVVSIDSLCDDLLDWNSLYLAGRMHKPTHILRDDGRVRLAQQVNLASALRTALLLLPERFDEIELYRTIAGLSYTGDFRMRWAENPSKIDNIVERQLELFRTLYRPLLNALHSHITESSSPKVFLQDCSPQARAQLLLKLPVRLRERIQTIYFHRWNLHRAFTHTSSIDPPQLPSTDQLEIWTRIAADSTLHDSLKHSLVQIVARPALYQSCKGLFSAGLTKSIRYAANKVIKRFS
ncbi:hypothetical protein PTTG_01447 [Puccinia triticina 1-1 BBBD Race 1]|uniref:Phosphatidate cytidylyltransferase, mitochondrial n=2 Tax=Puccinia triticina TaxID=208348 RepID=A0A180H4L8_PUCT1|nr:uncharacterized protein PtA15_9A309 [Puccinia triticina]OAV99937.1 hypothetical protein PTTG_01447 [Puccinia triticina 1-1 BBBD Race 1]WAQ88184.1 hypothetical protein PtA15_9A309 [Puccinia triticina]WAR60372.1 hypothetical protein PtB15_9B311 [Puccinia triticina]